LLCCLMELGRLKLAVEWLWPILCVPVPYEVWWGYIRLDVIWAAFDLVKVA